jgi:hypothetical protein
MKTQAAFLAISLSLVCSADGVRHVDYDVDGTAKYANLTFTNEKGGTDQKQVKLPYHNEFYVRGGSVVSLSAQKVRVSRPNQLRVYRNEEELDNGRDGVVHVVIRVNAIVLQEASADAPFGIATASGRVE